MASDSDRASPSASGPQAIVEDRYERLDYAERWLGDGFREIQRNPAGFLLG